MRVTCRLPCFVLAAAAAAMLCILPADSQGVGGVPTEAAPPAAGAVPTLQQQPELTVPQQGNEPARAPGSAGESGTAMPQAGANSGTTETFTADPAEAAVQWPCAQRRVPTISAGTLWSGPSLDEGKDWDQDNDVAALAQKLASRRLALDEVDPLVARLAKDAGKDKDKKLTELFVGVLDTINTNRGEILEGIMRYARGQERLAERMRKEADAISEKLTDVQGPTGIAATQQNRDFAWDQRIFKERKQALTYVCETPSLLERRAYEVAKRIQAQL